MEYMAAQMDRQIEGAQVAYEEMCAEIDRLKAEYAKSERRALVFGDIVHSQVIAMQAAVIEGHLKTPAHGLQWIVNTLTGPGHLPDLDEARALGGAQAWFDRETETHEQFRATHPAPALVQRPIDDSDRYAFAKTLEGQVIVMETLKSRGAEALDQALDDAMVESGELGAA